MKLYLLVSYSRKLEEEHYATKQGTYAFLLVVNWFVCFNLGLALDYPILLGPMINSVVYIWCQLNPNVIIRFWFGTEFKAKIFPLVLAIMDLILYNDWIAQAIGILAGHAYYFSTTEWARLHGRPLFETPRFFQSLFRNPRMAQMSEGIYVEDYRDTGPTRLTPSTYSFPGTGRVLSDTAQFSILLGVRPFSISLAKFADLEVQVENGVKTLTINRPAKKNAISTQMFQEMTKSLYDSNDDKTTKIIVIRGTGNFFTAGNDLSSLFEDCQKKTTVNELEVSIFTKSLIDCRKPIVALVNGHAVGIGVTMLPHTDTVFASDKATFTTPFIKFGIPPTECCAGYLLPKVMGQAKAGEMLHFNATLTAAEAYTSNLITRVFPDAEFDKKAWEKIYQMAEHPLTSLVSSKEFLRGRERQVLHKIHDDEGAIVNINILAKAVMKLMSQQK
ncbi:enoyl-CoA delta isomerase 3, peroxisomal isoform X2 [Folsomia candida]|nr:enoyl-CoA delta isomerase 3, peroxisomal isoform X2 [Folsomia candida]